ncbi:TPA: NAD synthetase [Candidatus Woesearchaeota archaeon]|jgi:hypothetical protein|nr:NAD synthetase [Candidatus Woesearchaeota archaeon]
MYGHWNNLPDDFDPNQWFGFVYLITNNENQKKYIGKKQIHSYRRKKIKGRKNRKRIITESKWRDYTGSCDELNEDIALLGKNTFTFEVLRLCKTKGELTYSEVEYQIKLDVLSAQLNGEKEYYNSNIMSRWFSSSSWFCQDS